MVIIASGYSGTGSSAIMHLLSEYEDFTDGGLGKYEHLPFYTPHGLFDLEDALLQNNSIYQSDAALNDFYAAMKRLNDYDFGWCGGYQRRYGDKFMKIVDAFMQELIEYEADGYWSYDFKLENSMTAVIKDSIKKVLGKHVPNYGKKFDPYGDNKILFSFVDSEQFYKAARVFVKSYLEMICPESKKHLLLDQIILPQHLKRFENYFEDDVKCIVLDRDVRDIYVLTKYIWPEMLGSGRFFPDEPKAFIKFYRRMRATETHVDSPFVLRLHFEDLIYKYDETLKTIEEFIGVPSETHKFPKEKFKPEVSIKNTQNFRIEKEWEEEVSAIEKEMAEWVYDFPYVITPQRKETSDP